MVDWWSLGVMMHEMACSKLPFEDTNWEALQRKITVETPLFPAAIQEKKLTTVLNGKRCDFCLLEFVC
jgi:serine/threonine protein kinase